MKMIINKNIPRHWLAPLILFALILGACGKSETEISAEEQARLDSLNRLDKVRRVAAIAKVEPTNDLLELSAEVCGIVAEVVKKEGDSVGNGELILRLDAEEEDLELIFVRQEILAKQSRVAAAEAEVKQYEASLTEKEEDLAVTTRLASTGADTRQNVAVKQRELEVIRANLDAARAQLEVGRSELASLKTQVEQS